MRPACLDNPNITCRWDDTAGACPCQEPYEPEPARGNRHPDRRPSVTEQRHTTDTITDDQLDGLYAELAGARATIDHMSKAMSWIAGHDRQGLDHLDEAQYEARSREAAVRQAQSWAARARSAEAARDGAYRERAQLVAHLAALHPSTIGLTDPHAPDWAVVTIETPAGQMCWHIATDDYHLFEHVERSPDPVWDGHTTDVKYERLRQLTASAEPLPLDTPEP